MHRLLVPSELLSQESPLLPKDAAHHLRVLRPKTGEQVELFDGDGRKRAYRYDGDGIRADGDLLVSERTGAGIVLFACVTKGSRWDWTIEKATELGVSRIVPVISERTIVRLNADERAAKAERWRRVVEDAARQSDAVWVPRVDAAVDFVSSLPIVKSCRACFVGALVDPAPLPLMTAAEKVMDDVAAEYGVYVGPEGDFTPDELKKLLDIATPVSLGDSILRAETAAIYAVTVIAAMLSARKAISN